MTYRPPLSRGETFLLQIHLYFYSTNFNVLMNRMLRTSPPSTLMSSQPQRWLVGSKLERKRWERSAFLIFTDISQHGCTFEDWPTNKHENSVPVVLDLQFCFIHLDCIFCSRWFTVKWCWGKNVRPSSALSLQFSAAFWLSLACRSLPSLGVSNKQFCHHDGVY